jgi:hypothetical protein
VGHPELFLVGTKAVGALRQALALRGAGAPLQILFGRFATESPPRLGLRLEECILLRGSFDCARMFIHRWRELWPRFAQDDIFCFLRSKSGAVHAGCDLAEDCFEGGVAVERGEGLVGGDVEDHVVVGGDGSFQIGDGFLFSA